LKPGDRRFQREKIQKEENPDQTEAQELSEEVRLPVVAEAQTESLDDIF
jgi:hypothetical protein